MPRCPRPARPTRQSGCTPPRGPARAAEYLDDEYVTTKILTLLGDADKSREVLKRKDAEASDRYQQTETELEELKNQQEVNDDADVE